MEIRDYRAAKGSGLKIKMWHSLGLKDKRQRGKSRAFQRVLRDLCVVHFITSLGCLQVFFTSFPFLTTFGMPHGGLQMCELYINTYKIYYKVVK